ncbi:MAG: ABC transporter permease [Asticcacaulis sp.]|uniref:ABC transporter permease n=1 Tax=Asticcacaulis sp. TaxID=1872648 RepID=UPI0039E3442D
MTFLTQFLRNPLALAGSLILGLVVLSAVVAPVLFPADPLRIVGPALVAPFTDGHFPLGTDGLGRDILALILHGASTTLAIGVSAALTALVIGVTIGAIAGYYGGWIGNLFGRLIELFQTIPGIVFLLALVSLFGPHMVFIVLIIGMVSWESIARLTRAEVMAWKKRDFILACRTIGMTDIGIIFSEILPNALAPVIAVSTLSVAGAILVESGLSFLNLSDPNVATWGRLVGDGRSMITSAWYISAIPGVAIVITVFALSLVSDGLGEILNPRLRR